MTLHMLTQTINGQRHRYGGLWDDEAFQSLPYIKEYGCVPSGWQSYHLEEGEIEHKGPRVASLAALPLRASGTNAEWQLRDALQQRQAEEAQRPCSFSYHGDGPERSVLGSRATGRRYHEGHQRYVIFNGYVCDMHVEEIKGLRWR